MSPIEQFLPEVTRRLVEQFRPETIFLFGSHACGNPNADSDMDLLVVVPQSDISPTQRASLAYRCLRDILYPLDILVRTTQEMERFAHVPGSLEYQILSEGKRLYG